MSTFEWFLLIVVVIAVPLIVAVIVTMWTLEQARQRNRKNRSDGSTEPVKRLATRRAVPETGAGDTRSGSETERTIRDPR